MSTTETSSTEPVDAQTIQYLSFLLGGEEYGIPILEVQEIRGSTEPTPIPNTAEHVLGVINLRGAIVPVLDLRRCFGMPEAEDADSGVTILVTPGSRVVGLVVDAVCDVVDVSPEDVTAVPDLAAVIDENYITGMARRDDRLLLMLDIAAVVRGGMPSPGSDRISEDLKQA